MVEQSSKPQNDIAFYAMYRTAFHCISCGRITHTEEEMGAHTCHMRGNGELYVERN